MNLKGLTFSFLMLGLASCTVTVDEPRPVRPEPPVSACPRIYQPVCAMRGRERQTFSNQCLAANQGFDTIYLGECHRGPLTPRPPRPPYPPVNPDPEPMGPVVCTQEYAPVCGRLSDIVRTFSNRCMAEGSGFRVIGNGVCRG
jgi:Kazal-type serine protease inhibitor domain